jgi:3-deoxy-7-phosphoheptulonate synthase
MPHAPTDFPASWTERPNAQPILYDDPAALAQATARLKALPPLVTSWEVERLKKLIADAQEGKRFLLQGGDCAETLADCSSPVLANKLKILMQMSLVLSYGFQAPVIRIGRFAGQYAKPRSNPYETREGVRLPSYMGDLVNRPEFTPEARRPDPALLLSGYHHASLTLNFVRALSSVGFSDLHHPEYWDLSFFRQAAIPRELQEAYEATTRQVSESVRFMEALGGQPMQEFSHVEFYSSHEALNLHYEAAQTRRVPHHPGFYDLTTHFPWIGERTRSLDGAHVEFFRHVRNPVGVKVGPTTAPADVLRLVERLNPDDEPGKLVLITRMGAAKVEAALPPLIDEVRQSGRRVLWVCDPMHGNTQTTASGVKTRDFAHILAELEATLAIHGARGSRLGGVHFELTGDDVTECLGGAQGMSADDLSRNYASACDPRLNYRQSLEMGFRLSQRLRALKQRG